MILLMAHLLIASAWSSPDLVTAPERTSSAEFQYLRSKNCTKIFFVPSSYEFEPEKSALLPGSVQVNGSVHKAVRIFLSLKPKMTEPDESERAGIRKWSIDIGGCPNSDPQLEPYPAYLISMDPPAINHSSQVFGAKIERLSAGRMVLRIEASDSPSALNNVLEALTEYRPRLSYQIFNEVLMARSTLMADYEGSAEFLKEYFYRRICYLTESRDIFRRKSVHEHCDFVPEVHVNLKAAELKGVIGFYDEFPVNTPQSLIASLHGRLLSRLAMSTFEISSTSRVNEMLRLELGNLNKSVRGSYKDSITLEEIRSDYAGREIEIKNLDDFVREKLKELQIK
jgi:hypothetical protein